jgi:DNA mismatch repair protein MutS
VIHPCNDGQDVIKSQVKTTGLRHILIEHLLTNETYTPNDIELSDEPQGVLLFGINSSGKTSLLRSLGIAIILAQSGNFVPATTFEYTPYRSIYSRIVGNDNLFKGHSSFAVEMTELRVILRMADQHSLVLADEISKGSEMDSAISITTAALMNFVALKCSFMITSHLHEIVDYDEIKAMSKQLHLKHLLVSFDYEKDTLVYDRTLKDGSGESFYGLLVCKSLHLPQPFIEQAYKIRQKYLVKDKGILSQKTSIYNAKKIRGMCEQCGIRPSDETHHIMPQKLADANGFFPNGLHMNHVANLSALCTSCHDTIHSSEEPDLTSTVTEDSLIKKKKIKIVVKPKAKPT